MNRRIIKFGRLNDQEIKWEVLFEDEFKMLVISEKSIGSYRFSVDANSSWENSDIRKYLNDTFWKNCFSMEEKQRVLNTKLEDVNTKDNIFLISKEEADTYLSGEECVRRGYWCTRTSKSTSSIIRYSNGWGDNTAGTNYATFPLMYIIKDKSVPSNLKTVVNNINKSVEDIAKSTDSANINAVLKSENFKHIMRLYTANLKKIE